MIAHLHGRILRKAPQEVVVDVAGVGYRVSIPVSTFYRLGEEGAETSLRVHTHVRDDVLALYGFSSAFEQDLFERLIQVAGVGPRLAVNILSGIEAPDLASAIRSGDLARLTRVPGVGKKTAERLVVELKDKMPQAVAAAADEAPAAGGPKDDLLSALANLGYTRPEAERGIERALREQNSSGRFEDLLRRALQIVSGR
jgi:Holliday junction DNA helicase RuvA